MLLDISGVYFFLLQNDIAQHRYSILFLHLQVDVPRFSYIMNEAIEFLLESGS